MSVGPMTQNAFVQSLPQLTSRTLGISDSTLTAPPLTWERGIQTILEQVRCELALDDAVAVFINAAFWEGSHFSV